MQLHIFRLTTVAKCNTTTNYPEKINSLANLIAAVARLAVENIVNIQLIIS